MKRKYRPDLNAHVVIDGQERIRSIRHSKKYWVSDQNRPIPAAIEYLNKMVDEYRIPKDQITNMEKTVSYNDPKQQGIEYHLSEIKEGPSSSTIGFVQTFLNIPVWRAGLKVTLKHDPYRIIRSVNTSQEGIDATLPSQDVLEKYQEIFSKAELVEKFRRENNQEADLDYQADFLLDLLKIESEKRSEIQIDQGKTRVIRGRFFIYMYDEKNRLPSREEDASHEVRPKIVPSLPLPEIDEGIKQGKYYVVAEITFSFTTAEFGKINWRALVELNTGSILYLRSLVDYVNGLVFLLDPISASGDSSKTCDQPNAVLNPLRDDVVLNNLDPPVLGVQSLVGKYAALAEMNNPLVAAPTEPTATDFDDNVRTDDFAAVSAYFHVNRFFEVVESLGFSISSYFSNTNFPIQVDHRGCGGAINAWIVYDGAGGIDYVCYGIMDTTGGSTLGRASDPRVHWHELGGHGILYEHVDSGVFGFSHSAGDSLSGIFYDPESNAPGDQRFEYVPWHPTLRRRFDRDVADGWAWGGSHDNRGYGSEEILATTLFRIYRSIGGDSINVVKKRFASRMMLYLILKAVENLTPATNPQYAREFADELMDADQLNWLSEGVYGGAYSKVIRWAFEKQGEYQDPLVSIGDPAHGTITSAGQPPEVDVYIDDGRNGEYDFRESIWTTSSIWNRLAPDGVTVHETPVLNTTNYAYVKIKNRGTQPATNVVVKGYHSKHAAGTDWPNDLQPFTIAEINVGTIAGNNSEELIVGPFEWTPIINANGNDCMMMIVSADQDPCNVENFTTGETIPAWRLVPNDNNIGLRKVIIPSDPCEREPCKSKRKEYLKSVADAEIAKDLLKTACNRRNRWARRATGVAIAIIALLAMLISCLSLSGSLASNLFLVIQMALLIMLLVLVVVIVWWRNVIINVELLRIDCQNAQKLVLITYKEMVDSCPKACLEPLKTVACSC